MPDVFLPRLDPALVYGKTNNREANAKNGSNVVSVLHRDTLGEKLLFLSPSIRFLVSFHNLNIFFKKNVKFTALKASLES